MLTLIVIIIGIALIFDYINGFHDSANSISTVVSTRVLTPLQAVIWAAFFNFVAAFFLDVHVAKTIGKGLIDVQFVDYNVILGGLMGAISWNLLTWYWGIPSSSSHALIGGYAGAAIAKAGSGVLILSGWTKTILFIVLSPLIGFAIALALMLLLFHLFQNAPPGRVNRYFRLLQLFSAALYSLGHGTNDAQKTMGIIAGLLFSIPAYQHLVTTADGSMRIPLWIILLCHTAIALGTMAGGWRIVKTMGHRITKLRPIGGFCAETAGAMTILGASVAGIPVSTTHTITGAIVGVGSVRRLSAVRWGIASRIVWAWILTIPFSAFIGALSYRATALFL
ncbi:inorganic phosphate transporter [Candidatus Peregrinibacteria bacterium]|nr:inorganic phosphate transporter [Candidatus Peregrinibacteria bacterium]MBI2524083.1 inorganic phosphate transporter [Candidatus Peregrinibacteria bacterium]MBI4129513.1 inorganic phosphate transporter [Candidatus Peregrinibacteria bacterium]